MLTLSKTKFIKSYISFFLLTIILESILIIFMSIGIFNFQLKKYKKMNFFSIFFLTKMHLLCLQKFKNMFLR